MEQEELNTFKSLLSTFIKNQYRACDGFHASLFNCNHEHEIVWLFEKHARHVCDELGGDSNLEDKVNELERDIEDLYCDIGELEDKLYDMTPPIVGSRMSLDDEYKIAAFHEHFNDFTSSEIEDLFNNAKNNKNK